MIWGALKVPDKKLIDLKKPSFRFLILGGTERLMMKESF